MDRTTPFVYVSNMAARVHAMQVRVLTCQYLYLKRWTFSDMSEPYWRLYWNPARGARLTLAGRRWALDPAHVFLIPPHTPCASDLERPLWHFYIHFTAGAPYDMLSHRILRFGVDPALRAKLRRLAAAGRGRGASLSAGETFALYGLVCEQLARVPGRIWPLGPTDPRIMAVQTRLAREPGSRHPNPALARELGLSTNAFIRLFKAQVGTAPQAYLMRLRLDRSCILLQHTAHSIEEIADLCGFCDRNHFSKMFKRHRGSGPAEYRVDARLRT